MLSIGKLGASPAQLEYYERQVAAGIEDYYAARGEAPGRWIGGGCGGICVGGPVGRDGFIAVMEGRAPTTGEVLRPAHGRARVSGFDLTFSAPKSVSVLYAIADDETARALTEAHDGAVDAAVAYVEREACFTRRGKDGLRRVRGEGFVAAAYRHRLSRAGDPQLHTHVVVANMTRAEGRWTSLDGHGLYEHKSAAGAVYRAVLRAELRERLPWVWWRQVGRGLFEIDGVPDAVLREFSRRRVEIEERARELTGVGASELPRGRVEGIALATRRAKEYGVDGAWWREEARARAAEHGLGERELHRLTSSTRSARSTSEVDAVPSAATRLSGPEGLTARHNTFAPRHALAELAGEFGQGASVDQLQRATGRYLEDRSVVALGGGDGEDRFTTRELLTSERAIIETARRQVDMGIAELTPEQADASCRLAGVGLNEEQAAAVETIAASGNGVDVLQALAGTGKTRVLGALASCYRDADYLILAVAPTGRAARELGEAVGTRAETLHGVVGAIGRAGGLLPRTVVLMDEAGMAPTRETAVLFEAAGRTGAKLIAAGDIGQLPSVQAGGWFGAIAAEVGEAELRTVIRQRDLGERTALEALHDGSPAEYVEFKQQQGTLTVHAERPEALRNLLVAWDRARVEHGLAGAIMIARDNSTRVQLNQAARDELLGDGTLAARAVVIGGREFRVGDRVIARRNDHHLDVDNGTRATVTAIDHRTGTVTIETGTENRRDLDATYVAEHLEHAYALTGHGIQGATVEWAGVIGRPSDFAAEWAYTALSRARRRTELHVIAEPSAQAREREDFAPPDAEITLEAALGGLALAMSRHEGEPLASQHIDTPTVAANRATPELHLKPNRFALRRERSGLERGVRIGR